LEEDGGIKPEDAQRGVYALEHNEPIYEWGLTKALILVERANFL
jgi:hypothetical protein